jgi:NTP pyrophosphatase (non-canonical NTP hydrolase)
MKYTKAVLQKARETYGARNQISVASEELCELAAVLQKFIRYSTVDKAVSHTRDNVISELADVYNVIDHIIHIYHITLEEIQKAQISKAERLEVWMNTAGKDLEYSMEYRNVRS